MGARKNINRYKEAPWGDNFDEVAKRAKNYFKDGVFIITRYNKTYTSSRPSLGFKDPDDAVYFTKTKGKWIKG